jgi:hypothetical protein
MALAIAEEDREEAGICPVRTKVPGYGIPLELCLDDVPGFAPDDGRVLARIALALMRDLAHVDRVGQELVDVPPRERFATRSRSIFRRPCLGPETEATGLSPAGQCREIQDHNDWSAVLIRG